ncbi:glycoprotein hormone alpha-2 isoform X1 [Strongylocentrotus purpuratus]|uniref:Putative glycoprotein hormone-alpha2 n=1 Tax=Strongylocentrotus purpuratus TaxID=7668 RepID=C6SUP9_STRPU|nr:glycoprotein hormone alpha-2 precursor [Strongylocentrotus purpuratus]XP_011670826.1 glycoprotein hormone alpha-2 isoform X1 [Strongylocentrotus purpuratus]CAR94704.1 TPA: putative glycoprotein hormone-alpha2 [Strongylocentrotus purpuratus]|eukprot:NP_001268687.1 glycoprotein hormone alpha-2 precursor [Strongylocentrotus purpuratus]
MKSEVLVVYAAFLVTSITLAAARQPLQPWQRPGCHLVGFTQKVEIPGCYVEMVAMNACRGFCNSYSYTSEWTTLVASQGRQKFTTYGRCCAIKDTHEVHVLLECENNIRKRVTFRSAASCECSLCNIEND